MEIMDFYNNGEFRITWKETKWFVMKFKRVTYKIEAYGQVFHFDKDGLK